MPDTHSPALSAPLRPLNVATAEYGEEAIKRFIAGVGALRTSMQATLPNVEPEARPFIQDAINLLGDVASDLEGYSIAIRDREEVEANGFCMEGAE